MAAWVKDHMRGRKTHHFFDYRPKHDGTSNPRSGSDADGWAAVKGTAALELETLVADSGVAKGRFEEGI